MAIKLEAEKITDLELDVLVEAIDFLREHLDFTSEYADVTERIEAIESLSKKIYYYEDN